jgi:hypothetical protein
MLVISASLILTPSWSPATIVIVPVPLGFLLSITIFTGEWTDLAKWIALFPLWHAIALPATAIVSYIVVRTLLSNRPLQPTPPSGVAER